MSQAEELKLMRTLPEKESTTEEVTIQVNFATFTNVQPSATTAADQIKSEVKVIEAGDPKDDMERLSDISYELVDEDNIEEEQLDVFEEVF